MNDGTCTRRIFEARRLAEEPIRFEELPDEFGISRERLRQSPPSKK
jgi:DNA-directed RNA polymerase sigma subunit (sigma70/sigma32)